MVYGFARVSSRKQEREGNSLEAQENTIHERYPGCEIYKEVISGAKKRSDRKVFKGLLEKMVTGDVLVVTKLDRFCRSTKEGLDIIEGLLPRGISVHILNMGLIDGSPTGKLILTILLAFAEFERALMMERTAEGKAVARQKDGFREGRPNKFTKQQIELAMSLLENNSFSQVSEMTGISISSLTRAKRKQRVKMQEEERMAC